MAVTTARAYLSPTLVLLAFDWADGEQRNDFLGFAIKRTPGFLDFTTGALAASSFLPNRLNFNGPPAEGQPDFPSDQAPIQKFMWWDARLEGLAAGQAITYEISAVTGTSTNPQLDPTTTSTLTVALPAHEELGIGTWFNRAVMSSQAFSRRLKSLNLAAGAAPTPQQALALREWLANGMETPLPQFVSAATSIAGAIYHLTDGQWVIPAMKQAMAGTAMGMVYDAHIEKDDNGVPLPNPNDEAIATLTGVTFFKRNKTNIMHNKFLVAGEKLLADGETPARVICGSANYTTQGLTSQANLIHSFDSPDLAALYYNRLKVLKDNPTLGNTAKKQTGWSNTVSIGDAGIRAFFSPEKGDPGDPSVSIETIVQAIHKATSSVVFCLFMPTDKALRDACFAVGDGGKMMFGLVNRIAKEEPGLTPTASGNIPADQIAALEIFHRSKQNKDVIGAEFFHKSTVPQGFAVEMNIFPGDNPPSFPPVIIHHKFVVIDAETDSPVIYTGSANMSGNSVFKNDENLLEITGSPRLARIYIAEFLRLYEHYRARARFIAFKQSGTAPANVGFALRPDRTWADKHFTPGTPEFKARLRMLSVG
jgi:phosphatidylserine/phosphatidylglycerophosphate/cardiolipin synthase-like enzyme